MESEAVLIQYKLAFDSALEGFANRREAYSRMARAGTWLSGSFAEGGWWEPVPSQDAKKRITREGFIVLEEREERETGRAEMSNEETVTISKKEYEKLLEAAEFLACLEGAGVDNWDGYSLCLGTDD